MQAMDQTNFLLGRFPPLLDRKPATESGQ